MKKRLKNSRATANLVPVDPFAPDAVVIQTAADMLMQKGMLVFPTTGLYGLGADALCSEAVRRVFVVKQRPPDKPVLVLLSSIGDMGNLVQTIPEFAEPLLALWPGGITFVFNAKNSVPVVLTGGTGKVGVRMPAHPVAKALSAAFGSPITGTSANLSGRPAVARTVDLDPEIRSQVDMVLDAGTLHGGSGSTILDVSCWPVRVIHEGAVSRQQIAAVLKNS